MRHTHTKKEAIEAVHEEIQALNLLDKDFKSAIINMFGVPNKTMSKELKCKHDVSPNTEYQ